MAPYDGITHLRAMGPLQIGQLFSVQGKVVLVTGGTRGIGLMIAKAFVENGAKVYIASRKQAQCDAVAEELNKLGPGSAVGIAANLSSDAACKDLAAAVASRESILDVLVNNAGATWGSTFEDFPESSWDKVMAINVYGVFNLTRACVPLLKKASKGSEDPAHVIVISSVAGTPNSSSALDNAPSYAASKAAVNKVTQHLAAYLVKDGICVNAIAPAVFPSKMTYDYQLKDDNVAAMSEKMHPVGRVGNEVDMAGMVLFLSSKASAFVTGSIINLDGGTAALRSSM